MPRDLTSQMVSELASGSFRPALLVEANFANGPVRVWSGYGPLNWDSRTWLGVGSFGSVSSIEEGSNVEARGTTLSLSGIDPTLLDDVLGHYMPGLPVYVYLALFDDNGDVIPDPVIAWAGRMDAPTISVDSQTATLEIACESYLIDLKVAAIRRYCAEDQQLDYPGDRAFEFVPALQNRSIFWGRSPSSQNNA
jgi:hypothetical protein